VLSNLETDQEKLIQIILAGQPELLDKIRTPMMAQLDQRVSIRCALADLDEEETDRYIHHRLNVAGARGQIRFAPKAVAEIYHASHGVPRLINLVADRALLAGYAAQTRDIQPEHVRKAVAALRGEDAEVDANVASGAPRSMRSAAPVLGERKAARRAVWFAAAAGVLAVAAVATAGVYFWPRTARRATDEELYWRATGSASPAEAERDLNSLIATYPSSRRIDDALLRLAELELGRGDRTDAVAHLTDLARRGQTGVTRTRAMLLASVARLDGGDTVSACANRPMAVDSADAVNPLVARDLQNINALCTARDSVAAAAATVATDTTAGRAGNPAIVRGATPGVSRGRAPNDTARRPAAPRPRSPVPTPPTPTP
jgi:general secretion pathway protein A